MIESSRDLCPNKQNQLQISKNAVNLGNDKLRMRESMERDESPSETTSCQTPISASSSYKHFLGKAKNLIPLINIFMMTL